MIEIRPIELAAANAVIREWHSHHRPVKGHKCSISAYVDGAIEGVIIIGRPVAPALQDGFTWEVTRLCCKGVTNGGTKDVGSRLLSRAWSAADAQGIRLLVSYTRVDEDGTCYMAAGWVPASYVKGAGWTSGNKALRWLPGLYEPTTEIVDRIRWERSNIEPAIANEMRRGFRAAKAMGRAIAAIGAWRRLEAP